MSSTILSHNKELLTSFESESSNETDSFILRKNILEYFKKDIIPFCPSNEEVMFWLSSSITLYDNGLYLFNDESLYHFFVDIYSFSSFLECPFA